MLATPLAVMEADLVEQAREGDRNAFGEIVRSYHPGVVNVVYRMCGDPALAEDAAQETFIRAWLHFDSFQPHTSLRNWLYRIAVNAALDALRKKREMPAGEDLLLDPDPHPGPEADLLQKERTELVRNAIGSLAKTSRAVLVLREYGGLSYQEIASSLEIPVGTVMSRLNYARNRLREILEPELATLESEND